MSCFWCFCRTICLLSKYLIIFFDFYIKMVSSYFECLIKFDSLLKQKRKKTQFFFNHLSHYYLCFFFLFYCLLSSDYFHFIFSSFSSLYFRSSSFYIIFIISFLFLFLLFIFPFFLFLFLFFLSIFCYISFAFLNISFFLYFFHCIFHSQYSILKSWRIWLISFHLTFSLETISEGETQTNLTIVSLFHMLHRF